jgi:hypothetical protein
MRGTIHLVPAEDAAWMLHLLSQVIVGTAVFAGRRGLMKRPSERARIFWQNSCKAKR